MKIVLLASLAAASLVQAEPPASPSPPVFTSGPWQPAQRLAAQKEAMTALAFLDGTWRGSAGEGGRSFVQTERVGTLLDGTIRLVEGRGYGPGGETVFNALGVISYDPARRAFSIRSYAMGYAGDYPLEVRSNGFSWSHPAGPGAQMRYQATVTADEWHQVGERLVNGQAPQQIFEMRLRRVGGSSWPQASAVGPD